MLKANKIKRIYRQMIQSFNDDSDKLFVNTNQLAERDQCSRAYGYKGRNLEMLDIKSSLTCPLNSNLQYYIELLSSLHRLTDIKSFNSCLGLIVLFPSHILQCTTWFGAWKKTHFIMGKISPTSTSSLLFLEQTYGVTFSFTF